MGSERPEQTEEQQCAAFWPDAQIQQRHSKNTKQSKNNKKKYHIDPFVLSSVGPAQKHTSEVKWSCIWDSVAVRSFSIGFVGWGSSPEQQRTNPVPCV